MADLIDRQAAIDAINKELDRETVVSRWVREVAVDAVKVLPTAQPSATDTNVGGNLIDRQAALDRIEAIKPVNPAKSEYTHGIDTGLAMAMVAIKEQPSAQPETIPIDYCDCANAMLKMWMDNVVTDGEYYRIMDKLNALWGKKDG